MGRKNVRAVKHRRHRKGQGAPPQVRRHYPKLERMQGLSAIVRPVGMCGKKLKFDTEANAATALQQAQDAHRGTGRIEKRYYECDRCRGYHLTSLEKWVPPEEYHKTKKKGPIT